MNRSIPVTSLTLLEELTAPVQAVMRLLAENSIDHFDNMKDLAERLGYRIEYVSSLPSKNSGFATFDNEGLPFIVVNSSTTAIHQEVTIAEEIGHLKLAHHRQHWRSVEELDEEARLFACTLLLHSGAMISISEYQDHNPDVAGILLTPLTLGLFPELVSVALALIESCGPKTTAGTGCFSERLCRMWEFLADEKTLLSSPDPRRKCRKPLIPTAFGAIKRILTRKPTESMMKRQ